MEKELRLGCVGDNCMDVYEALGQSFPGGNPVNVAVYTMRMGGKASYVGVTGTDKYGPLMIDAIKSKGVDISHLHVADGETAKTYVEMKDGDRVFGKYVEGVMEHFRLTQDDVDFLAGHDMVVSGIYGRTFDQIERVKAAGVPVAFDFSDCPATDPRIAAAIDHVDYAFFSYDDPDVEDFCRRMWRDSMTILVATRGENGSVAFDGKSFYHQGIVECPVVDTMGCGDSFIAGFLFCIMRGGSIAEAMQAGADSSAVTIQYRAAW